MDHRRTLMANRGLPLVDEMMEVLPPILAERVKNFLKKPRHAELLFSMSPKQ